MIRPTALLIALFFFALTIGCKSNPPAAPSAETTTKSIPLDPATLGQIEGTITFKGIQPTPIKIDTSMDPACGLSGGPEPVAQQYVVANGHLANVYLYIQSGPPAAMTPPGSTQPPTVMDQKGCIYTPHVVAIQKGGSVEFHNDDPTMHNIHTMPTVVGNTPIDVSQSPRGAPQTRIFANPEAMIPVRCNNHPWMNAFINVSPTPFFAISGADGHFTLTGLPPGTYTLAAIHEKLGKQTLQVTVQPQSKSPANFAFSAE